MSLRPLTLETSGSVLLRRLKANQGKQAADQATQVGLARLKPGQDVETTEVAAWTVISRVLLNLSETITRN